MGKFKLLLFSTLTGLLLALSWPAIGNFSFLLFVAFVPLLMVEAELSKQKSSLKMILYAYLSFFVFNLVTTWWIYFASDWGAVAAIIFNALFMTVVFYLFHLTKKKVGVKEGYLGLIIYWIAFEYLHLNWELSWPWLTIGNAFANDIELIQWYEYTGVLGGSLWVLIINLFIFKAISSVEQGRNKRLSYMIMGVIVFVLAVICSQLINTDEEGGKIEAVIVQPNIDPYNEKFGGIPQAIQVKRMIDLARKEVTSSTDYLVLPETAFPEAYWEHELEYVYGPEEFKKLISEYPKLKVVIGASTSLYYTPGMKRSPTANQFSDGSAWYDNYNTALQLDTSKEILIHHKSKLVLGVEKLPFIRSIPLMKKLSINLGGTSGGLGTQEHPSVFESKNDSGIIAPIICYESVYGEYITQYTQSEANVFAIITNDGWWDDTPGYKQHLAYARLRAIENRRSILRSANTGISAIINQRGEVFDKTNWWEQAVIKGKVSLNETKTVYVKYGDYLGRTAGFITPLLLLLLVVKNLNKTQQRLGNKNS